MEGWMGKWIGAWMGLFMRLCVSIRAIVLHSSCFEMGKTEQRHYLKQSRHKNGLYLKTWIM